MEKLSLNETWKLCLKMWKWIAKEKKAGSQLSVGQLKRRWSQEHGYKKDEIQNDCFFCEYDKKTHTTAVVPKGEGCGACPGTRVDPYFDCMGKDYYYENHPIKFYKKLVSLNRVAAKNKSREA